MRATRAGRGNRLYCRPAGAAGELLQLAGFSTELLHVFAAFDLRPCLANADEDEDIEVVRLPLSAAINQLLDDELSDAKTLTGLLAFQRKYLVG